MTQAIANKLTDALLAAGLVATAEYKVNSLEDCVDDTDQLTAGVPSAADKNAYAEMQAAGEDIAP